MNDTISPCQGHTDSYLGPCEKREICRRYRLFVERPLGWAAHRSCRTNEYRFYVSIEYVVDESK